MFKNIVLTLPQNQPGTTYRQSFPRSGEKWELAGRFKGHGLAGRTRAAKDLQQVPEDHDDIDIHPHGHHQRRFGGNERAILDLVGELADRLGIVGGEAYEKEEPSVTDEQMEKGHAHKQGGNEKDHCRPNQSEESQTENGRKSGQIILCEQAIENGHSKRGRRCQKSQVNHLTSYGRGVERKDGAKKEALQSSIGQKEAAHRSR